MTTLASIYNSAVTDELVKISNADTTAGFLEDKLVAGSNITLTKNNSGGNETITIAASVSGGTRDTWAEDIHFYLDTVSGNDSNSGLTNLLPVQTWDRLMDVIATKDIQRTNPAVVQVTVQIAGTLVPPLDCSKLSYAFGTLQPSIVLVNFGAGVGPRFTFNCTNTSPLFVNNDGLSINITLANFSITNSLILQGDYFKGGLINKYNFDNCTLNMTATTQYISFDKCDVEFGSVAINYDVTNPDNQIIYLGEGFFRTINPLTLSGPRVSNYFATLSGLRTVAAFEQDPNWSIKLARTRKWQKVYALNTGAVTVQDLVSIVEL